jgi:site-specific recombinase XerD
MNNEKLEVPPVEGFREAFKEYLVQRNFRESTINGHLQAVGYFTKWIDENQLYEVENITQNNVLEYVQHEQKRNIDVATINNNLTSISKYFEFLKEEKRVSRNPARTLRIRGKLKTITEQPLKYADLEALYFTYKKLEKFTTKNLQERVNLTRQRNIIIVGLLVWQGLHSGELEKLEVSHINLDEGKIYIPSTARSNSRTLQLHVQQVLQLHSYLHGGIREKLKTSNGKPAANNEKLFNSKANDMLQYLLEELKGINPIIRNAQHIRASVILYWLKQYNKRQVQYMAGHKYIDSTEKYALQETDSLTDLLVKHHPFG